VKRLTAQTDLWGRPLGRLAPFWRYYGGKHRVAGRYPPPRYRTLIEPFAGSAGYACCYPHLDVILVESYPLIAACWRYLIAVSPDEIMAIPDIPDGGTVDDLPCCQEGRWLAGWWCNDATASPCKSPSAWKRNPHPDIGSLEFLCWNAAVRARIARQVQRIRHWRMIEGDYTAAPDIEATWFVDPPYAGRPGSHYVHGSKTLDYHALGDWCQSRRGHVMVCEAAGANWLPFVPFGEVRGAPGADRPGGGQEVIWCSP